MTSQVSSNLLGNKGRKNSHKYVFMLTIILQYFVTMFETEMFVAITMVYMVIEANSDTVSY